jgi:BioD-like phosphotransacetylase family protein
MSPTEILTLLLPVIEAGVIEATSPSPANLKGVILASARAVNVATGNKIPDADLVAAFNANYQLAVDLGAAPATPVAA